MKFKAVIFWLVIVSINLAQSNVIKDGDTYYFADRIIVKYKNSQPSLGKISNQFANKFGITEETETYSNIKDESTESNELKKIHTLKFSSPFNPIYIIKEIKKQKNIEWAEPHYLYELTFDPNDPVYNYTGIDTLKFEHLDVIQAKQAWDINQGSEDVIIAIVDTGIDWLHEDLADNIWTNPGEVENNGIDDDGNGFIDDIKGWDFGGDSGIPDNDPNEDRADHGTHVAGLASAVTNNGIGIASIGFNTKLMAVKTSQNDLRNSQGIALIAFGYEGIQYAADNRANIISCSWGGYSYSFNAQAIIDYAVSKGSLVIAAAGNDNSKAKFYPASYDGVLSVAGTNFVDQKASWSNYGTKIDVASPGVNIWSTWKNNSYASKDGTSMAAPIVAGLAGLVANQFPNYTPLQIGEQIRVNSDNIYQLNPSYQNKLGYGRINAQNALSNTSAKSARINELTLLEVGNKNGIFESGENIKIGFKITNYLNPTSNLNISFSTNDDNIEFVKNGGSIGALNTLQEIQTSVDFLEVSIKSTAATDVDVDVLVTYSDNNYTDYEWITFSINPTYQIHTTENLEVTFNSKGSIGFDDYPTNLKGRGLIFKSGLNLMFEGALLYGTSASTVVNTARNAGADAKDNDFNNITPIIISSPGSFADKESYTKFNDAFATPQSLGIETEVYTYSFDGEENADFIFIRYLFKNTTGNTITNFYAGQYWDFDLDETSYDDDLVNYDFTNNFGYVYDDNGDPISTHIGLALLSSNQVGFFAMDVDGTNNNVISWDGFTDEEKWTTLSSGLDYASVDSSDISAVISGGPFEILPNEKLQVDFVVVAGDNLQNLTNNMAVAKNKYNDLVTSIENENILPTTFELYQNYPNPFNPTTTIKYQIPNYIISNPQWGERSPGLKLSPNGRNDNTNLQIPTVRLAVYDVLGREIATLVNQKQKSGIYEINFDASNYSSGVYYYKLTVGASQGSSNSFIQTKKMLLLK